MLYRENGQFKTSYRSDQQIFPITQDRIAVALMVAAAFGLASSLSVVVLARRLAALREQLAAAIGIKHADQAGGADDDLEAAVIGVAAEIFRVDPAQIDVDSRPGSVPGWDSFSQLNFLMASEDRFGVTIPASLVAQIVSVADMVKAIRQLRT